MELRNVNSERDEQRDWVGKPREEKARVAMLGGCLGGMTGSKAWYIFLKTVKEIK